MEGVRSRCICKVKTDVNEGRVGAVALDLHFQPWLVASSRILWDREERYTPTHPSLKVEYNRLIGFSNYLPLYLADEIIYSRYPELETSFVLGLGQ